MKLPRAVVAAGVACALLAPTGDSDPTNEQQHLLYNSARTVAERVIWAMIADPTAPAPEAFKGNPDKVEFTDTVSDGKRFATFNVLTAPTRGELSDLHDREDFVALAPKVAEVTIEEGDCHTSNANRTTCRVDKVIFLNGPGEDGGQTTSWSSTEGTVASLWTAVENGVTPDFTRQFQAAQAAVRIATNLLPYSR